MRHCLSKIHSYVLIMFMLMVSMQIIAQTPSNDYMVANTSGALPKREVLSEVEGNQENKDSSASLEEVALPPPSSSAQKLYASAKNDLLQIRVLLKNGRSQSSVGSGFLIGTSNLVITNYHVVSQIVLEPETYLGEYVDTQGKRGSVELITVDVLHDLAVVRVDKHGTGFFKILKILLN